SEGFATYLTHIYIESKYGTDSLNNQMKADRRQVISFSRSNTRPVVDSISPYINLLNANSYQKGGWVLHMLRRQLGDTVFQQIIRRYYDKFKGKNADTRDFETVAEEVSGKNLKTFFDQWLYSSSLPQLEISWQYSDTQKSINLTVEQKQSLDFQFPLEVQIKSSAGNSTTHSLLITFEKQSFTLPVSGIPSSVIIDPHTSTLGEWIVKENK
ncbi:MAG: M1 family peptidase, partial [Bacteroidetes bacterium]|nr:M1 family peptidase [Bacteroidota bacterium]